MLCILYVDIRTCSNWVLCFAFSLPMSSISFVSILPHPASSHSIAGSRHTSNSFSITLIYSVLIWLFVLIAFVSNNILFHFCSISFFGPLCFLLYLYLFLGIYTSLFPVMCPTTLFSLDHNQFFLVFPFPAVPTSFPDLFFIS